MSYVLLITVALATFRLSRMVAEEDGPVDAFKRIRDRTSPWGNWISRGVRCQLCVGVWVSLFLSLYLVSVGLIDIRFAPIFWFASAGLAVKLRDFWSK